MSSTMCLIKHNGCITGHWSWCVYKQLRPKYTGKIQPRRWVTRGWSVPSRFGPPLNLPIKGVYWVYTSSNLFSIFLLLFEKKHPFSQSVQCTWNQFCSITDWIGVPCRQIHNGRHALYTSERRQGKNNWSRRRNFFGGSVEMCRRRVQEGATQFPQTPILASD